MDPTSGQTEENDSTCQSGFPRVHALQPDCHCVPLHRFSLLLVLVQIHTSVRHAHFPAPLSVPPPVCFFRIRNGIPAVVSIGFRRAPRLADPSTLMLCAMPTEVRFVIRYHECNSLPTLRAASGLQIRLGGLRCPQRGLTIRCRIAALAVWLQDAPTGDNRDPTFGERGPSAQYTTSRRSARRQARRPDAAGRGGGAA